MPTMNGKPYILQRAAEATNAATLATGLAALSGLTLETCMPSSEPSSQFSSEVLV